MMHTTTNDVDVE